MQRFAIVARDRSSIDYGDGLDRAGGIAIAVGDLEGDIEGVALVRGRVGEVGVLTGGELENQRAIHEALAAINAQQAAGEWESAQHAECRTGRDLISNRVV